MTNAHDSARPDAMPEGLSFHGVNVVLRLGYAVELTAAQAQMIAERLDACEAALKQIAAHQIDKHYWPYLSNHEIAQDCETAHDDLVAIALQAFAADGSG